MNTTPLYKRVFYGHIRVIEQEGGYCAPCIEISPTGKESDPDNRVLERGIESDFGGQFDTRRFRITIRELI